MMQSEDSDGMWSVWMNTIAVPASVRNEDGPLWSVPSAEHIRSARATVGAIGSSIRFVRFVQAKVCLRKFFFLEFGRQIDDPRTLTIGHGLRTSAGFVEVTSAGAAYPAAAMAALRWWGFCSTVCRLRFQRVRGGPWYRQRSSSRFFLTITGCETALRSILHEGPCQCTALSTRTGRSS